MPNKSKSSKGPQQHVLDLALKLKIEEIRVKNKRVLIYVLYVCIFFSLLFAYAIYAHNRATYKIERNYQEIADLIQSAYRGDERAHSQVMERFPILTKSRLPRSLRQVEKRPGDDGMELSEPFITYADEEDFDEFSGVVLYSRNDDTSYKIASIFNDSEIIKVTRMGEWSQIMISSGIPVWVHGDFVEPVDAQLIEVTGSSVRLRLVPELGKGNVLGVTNTGSILMKIEKKGAWYKVFSPANFKVWARTEELNALF